MASLSGLLPFCIAAIATSSPVHSQVSGGNDPSRLIVDAEQKPELDRRQVELLHHLLSELRPGDTTAILRERHLGVFRAADIDGKPGITADDTAIFGAREKAEKRARLASSLFVDDLDGDGAVTFDELLIAGQLEAGAGEHKQSSQAAPSSEMITTLADAYAQKRLFEFDVDGDRRLTLSDVDARISAEPITTTRRLKVPPDAFDTNSDGRVTEIELRAELDRWTKWFDLDADGVISGTEVHERKRLIQRSDALLNRRAGAGQNQCILPPIASSDEVVVIHARTGSAFIDLTFGGDFAEPVYMGEVVIPPGDAPLWIIASFGQQMLLRIDGASDRVAGLISVAATTGMTGHPPGAIVVATRCHAGFLGIQALEPGQTESNAQAASFARALRRDAVPVFAQNTIGRLDLATGQNDATNLLAGDDTPRAEGDAKYTRQALYFFSPGGFHDYAPDEVAVPKAVDLRERPLLPLEAGLLQLIDTGLIEPLVSPLSGVIRRIPPGSTAPQPSQKDLASGSPLIGGLLFHKTEEGGWIGREPLTYIAHTQPRIPPGLNGTRGIRMLIAKAPRKSPSGSTQSGCHRPGSLDDQPPSGDECVQ